MFKLRPMYGYPVKASNFSADMNLHEDGIWKLDLKTGFVRLLISLAQLRDACNLAENIPENEKVNHCIFNKAGTKFLFLYRYKIGNVGISSLLCANTDDGKISHLHTNRKISHYHWRDNTVALVWARTDSDGDRYYQINVEKKEFEIIGKGILDVYGDGHCTYSHDGKTVLTDTYPDKLRYQKLLLYHLSDNRLEEVCRFFSPWKFYENNRCDLHPRFSPDENWISVDSGHNSFRMQYVLSLNADKNP